MNKVRNLFAEFRERRQEIEMSIGQVKQELSKFDAVLLYGAGSSGIAFLDFLRRQGIEPAFFIDSNTEKIGKSCEGLRILGPEEVVGTVGDNSLVIVCINTDGIRYCKSFDEALRIGGHHGVYDKLHGLGCKNVVDYTWFRHCFCLFKGEKYNAPSCSDIDLMMEHEDEAAEVYDRLTDAESREIFEKIIRFRLLDDTIRIPTNSQDMQYFESEYYVPRSDAAFVDCGAFNGISLKTFLQVNGADFDAYYGIEPDIRNYEKLEAYVTGLPEAQREKIHLTSKAVWEDNGGIKLYALHGPGSFAADIGTQPAATTTIDELLRGEKATFIKMNIEGSEKQALKGAEKTIKQYKPALAIAGYHRTDDLWRIPLMIKEYRDDYRLYLRSYMNHLSFVYYAM